MPQWHIKGIIKTKIKLYAYIESAMKQIGKPSYQFSNIYKQIKISQAHTIIKYAEVSVLS